MNIGLDARAIFSPRPRGTGRNLHDAYRVIPGLRPRWQFTLYHQRPADQCPLVTRPDRAVNGTLWPPNVRTRRLDVPGDRLGTWLHLALPLAARTDRIDLLHLPAPAVPRWCPVPIVVTIHDLIPLKDTGDAPRRHQRQFRRHILRALRRAQHIITPSRATRDELCAEFRLSPQRVSVIPWAPDLEISGRLPDVNAQALNELRRRYKLDRPWLLNFSGSSARKNAKGLLAALARLRPELRSRQLLVLTGCASPSLRQELESLAARLGIAADCRILDFVPHEDLPALLAGAAALLMPSLAEGFGLPILDAFAAGVPVLTSRCSSMPEVAGEAAVYCDPQSPESIALGIARVLDPPTADRLIKAGRTRVREFTWERTAAAMCTVYESCLAEPAADWPRRRVEVGA